MSFRFRRTIRIFPGIRVNLSKSGVSLSIGIPGCTFNISRHGIKRTFGIPGTGFSWSKKLGKKKE